MDVYYLQESRFLTRDHEDILRNFFSVQHILMDVRDVRDVVSRLMIQSVKAVCALAFADTAGRLCVLDFIINDMGLCAQ